MLEQAVPQIVCAWIWNYVYLINKKAGKTHREGCHRKVQWFLQLTAKSEKFNWWMSMAYKAAQRRALNQKNYLKQWEEGHGESEGEIWPQKQKPGRESPVCLGLFFVFFFKKATSTCFFQVKEVWLLNLDGNSFQSNWSSVRSYSVIRLSMSPWG